MADSYEIAQGHVTVDTKFDGRRVTRRSYFAGQQASRWFERGFRQGSLRRFNKMWSVFLRPLNNLKKWLTRLRMPAIFAGIAGSILALVPALTQVSSVVGVGMIPAFLSLGSTIFLIRGMLGKFASSIENQVQKKMDEFGDSIKRVAAEAAKPGLNAFLKEALRHTPILNKYVRELAEGFSDVGFAFRDLLRRQTNIQRIRFTLDQTAQASQKWYSFLDEAAEVLIALASVGAPLFLRFTNQMERVVHTIHDWIMLKTATGELAIYLNNAYRTLEKFGRGIRDFLIGLFNIINGGVFGAEKIGDSFERWGAAFREWTTHSENIDKIRKTIQWFVDHVGHFFRFAAAATAVQLALMGLTKIKGLAMFARTLLMLGPAGFALFGLGSALAFVASGFVHAFTVSEEFRKRLGDLVSEVRDRLAPIFGDWWKWIKSDLIPTLDDLAIQGIEMLGDSIRGLLTTIEDNQAALKEWRPVILFLIKAIAFFSGTIIRGFVEELDGLITALGWVGRGIKLFREAFATAKEWIGDAVDWIARKFREFKEGIGREIDETATEFRELPGRITSWLKSLPGALVRLFNRAFDELIYIIGYNIGSIVEMFVRLPGRVISVLDNFWDRLFASTKRDIGTWVDFFARLPGRVMRWFDRTWDSAYETTVEWFGKMKTFISELPGRVGTWLVNLGPKVKARFTETWQGAQKTSGTLVAKFITWASQIPQRVWNALVRLKNRLVERFSAGWAAATGTSQTKVKGIINFILGIPGRAFNALRALAAKLADRARTGWSEFQKALGNRVASTIVYISQIPERIRKGLGAIGTKLRESGRQLIQGLLTGVQARIREIGGLGSWFKANLVNPIVGAVKRFFGIKSPSRVFQGIGQYIVAGLWKGIASGNAGKMIGKIFGSMPDALVAMVQKGLISVANLPQKALAKLGGLFDDLFGGGGGSAGGLVGFARLAWDVFSKAFGLTMGGWRAKGSVPGSDHPKGKAIDIMTTNPLLHRLIIELGKRLPGAKYWISMRKIAMASQGWKVRPYSGPSPHTDHVHWSFFRQGGRLPEDVMGFGARSGRGYMLHKGEDVIRRNQTTIGHQGAVNHYHFQPGSVVLDASSVKDLRDVVGLIQGLQSTARMYGAGSTRRVA